MKEEKYEKIVVKARIYKEVEVTLLTLDEEEVKTVIKTAREIKRSDKCSSYEAVARSLYIASCCDTKEFYKVHKLIIELCLSYDV